MPEGLSKNTCPLADRLPKIWLALLSLMRFNATLLLPGCTNCTEASLPMLKVLQLATSLSLPWRTVMALPLCVTLARPLTT